MATGKPRRSLSGHGNFIGSLAMAPDGRRLLAASYDASGWLWDVTLAGAAKPRKVAAHRGRRGRAWWEAALAGDDARAAFAAMADVAAAPDWAVALLRRELNPAPPAPTDAE